MRLFSTVTRRHKTVVNKELFHSCARWVLRQHSLKTALPFVHSPTLLAKTFYPVRASLCGRIQRCMQQKQPQYHGRAYSSCFHYSRPVLNDTADFQHSTGDTRMQGSSQVRPSASVPPRYSEPIMRMGVLPRSSQEIFVTIFPTTRFTGASHGVKSSDVFQKDVLLSRKTASLDDFFSQIHQDLGWKKMPARAGTHRRLRGDPTSNTARASTWVGLKTMLGVLSSLGTTNTLRDDNEHRTPAYIKPEKHLSSDPRSVNTEVHENYNRYREAHRLWSEVKYKLTRDQAILADIYKRINEDNPWNMTQNDNGARQEMIRSMWHLFFLFICMLAWFIFDIIEYIELTRQLSYVRYMEVTKFYNIDRNYGFTHRLDKKGRKGGNKDNDCGDAQDSSSSNETQTSKNNVKND